MKRVEDGERKIVSECDLAGNCSRKDKSFHLQIDFTLFHVSLLCVNVTCFMLMIMTKLRYVYFKMTLTSLTAQPEPL